MSEREKWSGGVWLVDPGNDCLICSNEEGAVAHSLDGDLRLAEANAQLIAAAPDLYEALSELLMMFDSPVSDFPEPEGWPGPHDLNKGYTALAKARGDFKK